MAERNPYPASWSTGSRIAVREYPIKSAAVWLAGDLLKLTSGELEVSGADPTAVVGTALAGSVESNALTTGKAEVYVADTQGEWNWPFSGSTPTIGAEYGVVLSAGVWYLDQSETATKVLRVTRLDPNSTTRCYARFSTVALQG